MSERNSLASPLYKGPSPHAAPAVAKLRSLGLGLLLFLLFCWIATQYVAARLQYQSALGTPMLILGHLKLYGPADWFGWYHRWHTLDFAVVHSAFRAAGVISALGGIATVVFMVHEGKRRRAQSALDSEGLHGSAHWASIGEVKATGLMGNSSGVYVGAWKEPDSGQIHYLRHDGPEHIMAFAPTRSGKGVGLVLPTLLSWPHSALIYDIKGENWALTAGWRQQEADNHVLKFEPSATDGSSVRYNPLASVRIGTEREVADVQNIMTMIVDPDGKGLKDHWQKSSQALLVGVALHVLYAEPNKTLNGVIGFLSDPARSSSDAMKWILDTDHDMTGSGWPNPDGTPNYCHPVAASAARDMLNKADEERSSVISTAISFLTLYRDPIVARNTSASDFTLSDLMNSDKPVSLYLVVPPSDKDRLRPLIRLMINQIIRGLTEKMEFKDGRSTAGYKHRMLLMLDEFPSLGKLDVFEESLAFIAGYGLKAYLIIQDISQLWTAYGKDESIFSNCQVRVAYAPNKIETAELLSKMTGTATVVKQNYSTQGGVLGGKKTITTSTAETQRPLLTADEVMRLPAAHKDGAGNVQEAGDMLIFMAGQTPIYGKQILYFMDPVFSKRAKVPAPQSSDVLRVKESPPLPAPTARSVTQPAAAPAATAQPPQAAPAGNAQAMPPPQANSPQPGYGPPPQPAPAGYQQPMPPPGYYPQPAYAAPPQYASVGNQQPIPPPGYYPQPGYGPPPPAASVGNQQPMPPPGYYPQPGYGPPPQAAPPGYQQPMPPPDYYPQPGYGPPPQAAPPGYQQPMPPPDYYPQPGYGPPPQAAPAGYQQPMPPPDYYPQPGYGPPPQAAPAGYQQPVPPPGYYAQPGYGLPPQYPPPAANQQPTPPPGYYAQPGYEPPPQSAAPADEPQDRAPLDGDAQSEFGPESDSAWDDDEEMPSAQQPGNDPVLQWAEEQLPSDSAPDPSPTWSEQDAPSQENDQELESEASPQSASASSTVRLPAGDVTTDASPTAASAAGTHDADVGSLAADVPVAASA